MSAPDPLFAATELVRTLGQAATAEAVLEAACARLLALAGARSCVAVLDDAGGAARLVRAAVAPGAEPPAEAEALELDARTRGGASGEPAGGLAASLAPAAGTLQLRGVPAAFAPLLELVGAAAGVALERARMVARTQEADRRRDELLALVTHDLRDSLGVVAMSSSLLVRGAGDDERGQRLGRWARTAERAAGEMSRIMIHLADASLIERRALSIQSGPADAADVADAALAIAAGLAEERRARVDARLPAPGALPLSGDRDRLVQAVSSLLEVALELSSVGGAVVLEAAAEDGHARFSIACRAESAPRAEDLARSSWRQGGVRAGMGLRLFVARGIVEAHGGALEVASADGSTAFRCLLPR